MRYTGELFRTKLARRFTGDLGVEKVRQRALVRDFEASMPRNMCWRRIRMLSFKHRYRKTRSNFLIRTWSRSPCQPGRRDPIDHNQLFIG